MVSINTALQTLLLWALLDPIEISVNDSGLLNIWKSNYRNCQEGRMYSTFSSHFQLISILSVHTILLGCNVTTRKSTEAWFWWWAFFCFELFFLWIFEKHIEFIISFVKHVKHFKVYKQKNPKIPVVLLLNNLTGVWRGYTEEWVWTRAFGNGAEQGKPKNIACFYHQI